MSWAIAAGLKTGPTYARTPSPKPEAKKSLCEPVKPTTESPKPKAQSRKPKAQWTKPLDGRRIDGWRAGMKRVLSAVVGLCGLAALAVEPSAQTPAARQVTFTKDVAPILQRSCQNCHRPGSIGPMALLTYDDARPWARAIKQRTSDHQMPPWHIDRTAGTIHRFKDDISLSDAEIATIAAWVDAGAPRGNPADMPPPRTFDDLDRWHIGKPDLIVTMPKPVTVAPEGPDWWANYVADTGLTEDRYIKAVEAKPGAGAAIKIVHHEVINLAGPDDSPAGGGTLVEYAVGKNGDIYPDGAARLIKAGSKLRFNMHYHS